MTTSSFIYNCEENKHTTTSLQTSPIEGNQEASNKMDEGQTLQRQPTHQHHISDTGSVRWEGMQEGKQGDREPTKRWK